MTEKPERPNLDAIEQKLRQHDANEQRPGGWTSDDFWMPSEQKRWLRESCAYIRALETERDALKAREAEAAALIRVLLRPEIALKAELRGLYPPIVTCQFCMKAGPTGTAIEHSGGCYVLRARAWLDGV